MKRPVLCVVDTAGRAQRIVAQLRRSGFAREVISLVCRDSADRADVSAQGWLVAVALVVLPGLGSVIAAGLILAALSGPVKTDLADIIRGWGVPRDGAQEYEERIAGGSALVSVHTDSNEERDVAKQVFESNGCVDVRVAGDDAARRSNDGNV